MLLGSEANERTMFAVASKITDGYGSLTDCNVPDLVLF